MPPVAPSVSGILALSRGASVVISAPEATSAHVHSVFPRVVNLRTDRTVIALAGPELEVGPLTVTVDLPAGFDWRPVLRPDQPVIVGRFRLDFGPARPSLSASGARVVDTRPSLPPLSGGRAGLATRVEQLHDMLSSRSFTADRPSLPCPPSRADLTPSPILDLTPSPPSLKGRGKDGARTFPLPFREGGEGVRSKMGEGIRSGPGEGVTSVDRAFLALAAPALGQLEAGVLTGSPALVTQGAAGLAGLGPGLTPSGDDLLCGAMAALWHIGRALGLDPRRLDRLSTAMLGAAVPRTGALSGAWLTAAARGEVHPAVGRLLVALAGGSTDAIRSAAREVVGIGHTSGTDLLSGVLFGANLALALASPPRGWAGTQHSALSTQHSALSTQYSFRS